jgi:hypothetical protein
MLKKLGMKIMLTKLKTKKGSVRIFGLFVLSTLAATACSFNVSTATLENIKMCVEKPENQTCASDTAQFDTAIPKIFATADLKFAPEGTKVKIDWKYLGGDTAKATDIASIDLVTESDTNLVSSNLNAPSNGFPEGNYEVVISLGTDNSKPISKKFSISKSQ